MRKILTICIVMVAIVAAAQCYGQSPVGKWNILMPNEQGMPGTVSIRIDLNDKGVLKGQASLNATTTIPALGDYEGMMKLEVGGRATGEWNMEGDSLQMRIEPKSISTQMGRIEFPNMDSDKAQLLIGQMRGNMSMIEQSLIPRLKEFFLSLNGKYAISSLTDKQMHLTGNDGNAIVLKR